MNIHSRLVYCARLVRAVSAIPAVLAVAFLTTNTALAQSNIQGFIYGSAGTSAKDSVVTVVNSATGLKRTTTADAIGQFNIPALPPGRYTVTIGTNKSEAEVNLGTGTEIRFDRPVDQTVRMAAVDVSAEQVPPIDMSRVESVTIFHTDMIAELPVERNSTAVALLAPGTAQGVAGFGNLASFGGSSVAENAYYVNGFNLTNFRTGLGGGTVPFEFYDEMEVKTGGYGAEFGRSTGGVINATTKSGSNTFHAGANFYYTPNAQQATTPTVAKDGVIYSNTKFDYSQSYSYNLFASGPFIKNKVFFYGLYNGRKTRAESARSGTTFSTAQSTSPFMSGKIDWNITDKHSLSLTAISDRRNTLSDSFVFDPSTRYKGASRGAVISNNGGRDYIVNYSGQITSDLTVTALWGKGTQAGTDKPQGLAPYIVDGRSGPATVVSGSSARPTTLDETRKSYRLDATYRFRLMGGHSLRFGYDREDMASVTETGYAVGGIYYRYYPAVGGVTKVNGVTIPADATQYVRQQAYSNFGSFSTIAKAAYFDDSWKPNDGRLLLSIGLRNDEFNNKNKNGESFVSLKKQLAPRLGLNFDVNQDGKSKLYANWGRYTMPIANNTNIRFSGGEVYSQDYYVLKSVDASTKLPTVGAQLGTKYYLPGEDGTMKDPKTIVNQDLKPMYQDELIVGYQKQLNQNWVVGMRGTSRVMTHFIEDIGVDLIPGNDDTYVDVLTNPGQTLRIWGDAGDGKGLRQFVLSPSQQTYGGQQQPLVSRKYYALEFSFERVNHGKGWLQGSYTLSHSYGNNEGSVYSDIAQADNGLTQLFDYPQIMDGSYGNLNNDRRHNFKIMGGYKLNKEFQVSATGSIQSGAPKVAMGYYPNADANLSAYGAAYKYVNGKLTPRGSLGTQKMLKQLNVSLKYTPEWAKNKVSFGMDIYNIFNTHTVTETSATAENGGSGVPYGGFGLPTAFQPSRYMRVSASYKY
ncbi:MAG: hypothetical protein RL324_609 [Verrucomicrobiota bacterium]